LNQQQKASIANLANKYGRQVFHSAYRLLSDCHQAEDVTQEVFLKLFKKPTSAFDKIEHWPAYLKHMAISAAIDQLRRNTRLAEDPIEQLPIINEATDPCPSQHLAMQRDLVCFKSALLQLTTQDAQVFCLRHLEGHSYQEIAELLDISNSLVGVTLHRAQEKLAHYLGESQYLGESHAITN
tara:strand:- start:747 stop:1292 length:546 start_codon:yes stop_codon:yes gene_type:complete